MSLRATQNLKLEFTDPHWGQNGGTIRVDFSCVHQTGTLILSGHSQHLRGSEASAYVFVSIQSTDLVSMVYSCIGADIEDSDGSSTSDTRVTPDPETSAAVSKAPADTHSNGHVAPSDRQLDTCRQERIVPLADTRAELEEDGHGGGGTRPEPPPQSTKPSLAIMRQRHLQESSGNTGRSHLHHSTFRKKIQSIKMNRCSTRGKNLRRNQKKGHHSKKHNYKKHLLH